MSPPLLDLRYLATEFLWWQAVVGIRGGTSRTALRMHSRCMWRPRAGARHVHHTALRRARSPSAHAGVSLQTSMADPEAVAPIRPHVAIRDNSVIAHVRSTTPRDSRWVATRRGQHEPVSSSPPFKTGLAVE